MTKELDYYARRAAKGLMTRREFVGKAAALGVTAAVANTMLAQAVEAAGPVTGGTFKMGVQGGESTNSQDPASWASDVPISGGRCWGETLVEVGADGSVNGFVAESWEGSADAKTWRFKVRQGIEFSNGKSVKIFENRTRGPYSGVSTIWLRPYSPNPAFIA